MKHYQRIVVSLISILLLFLLAAQASALPREVRRRAISATVWIYGQGRISTPEGPRRGTWIGSGSMLTSDGLILTNYHVACDLVTRVPAEVLVVGFTLHTDQPPVPYCVARVIDGDPNLDLALIKCVSDLDGKAISIDFPAHAIGRSADLEIGDELYIFGYPGIGEGTINYTTGPVSGWADEGRWIKTDATIAGGNSGGAALNARGELVGVPTAIGQIETRPLGPGGAEVPIGQLNHIRPIDFAWTLIGPHIAGQPAGQPAQGGALVSGRIVSAQTGRGISGATIVILRPGVVLAQVTPANIRDLAFTAAQSDPDGSFQLPAELPVGQSYGVIIVANGYEPILVDDALDIEEAGPLYIGEVEMVRQGQ